jgi:predicted dehydrogenase/threonine dehydrogenase-like Zn-dependent dehydrogenase
LKQLVRRVIDRRGQVRLLELPEPHLGPNQVLVQNHFSLISSGTEMGTLSKTPAELVRQTFSDPWMRHVVHQTVFATGLGQTARRVWQEMIMPREIGYSGAGRVLDVGSQVEGFAVGRKVAYAACGHAELVAPGLNHIVPVPEELDLRHAAFVTVGGIALQAIRRAELQLGETVAIYGLGLVGQLALQLARAAGCVTIGIDINPDRVRLATSLGADLALNPQADDVTRRIQDATGKHGADATIICAASSSSEIVNRAMEITRRQGRVVLVGYVRLDIHPKNFLHREIDLRYSRAYGPGSYHRAYEKGRLDYPFGYVRWTEQRNLAEFIRLAANGALNLEPLIGEIFPLERAQEAFDSITTGNLAGVAALISYDTERPPDRRRSLDVRPRAKTPGRVGIGIIGTGNHVLGKHLPYLKGMRNVEVRTLAGATGKNAAMVATSAGATRITTDVAELLADPDLDGVLIASSQPEHTSHLQLAIRAGVPLYVEKPMVTRLEDFAVVAALMDESPVLFTLGLNRRYSPLLTRLRESLSGDIDAVEYLVAQPFVPPDHWTLDEVDGAGRLITEGEHFLDVCHLLIGREPETVWARPLGLAPDDLRKLCNFAITVSYGHALATVIFDECGGADFPRERISVYSKGAVAVLEDFARLTVHGKRKRTWGGSMKKEMGHEQALEAWVKALSGDDSPTLLDWTEARRATLTMFAAQESLRTGEVVDLRDFAGGIAAAAAAEPESDAAPTPE